MFNTSSEEIKTVRCRKCKRELTNPESREKGIGPKCEAKEEAKAQALYMNPEPPRENAIHETLIAFYKSAGRERK